MKVLEMVCVRTYFFPSLRCTFSKSICRVSDIPQEIQSFCIPVIAVRMAVRMMGHNICTSLSDYVTD